MKTNFLTVLLAAAAATTFAQGPGGGNQPGGGGGATFTFDSFLAETAAPSGILVREGTVVGYERPASATLGSTVADIAEGALAGCATLTDIDLSATAIAEIPDSAFAGCTALTTVTLPSCCTAIGPNAFAGCTALAAVTAPGVAEIGADAFRGCTALAAVPGASPALGAYAMANTALSSVDLGSLGSVSEGAFAGCGSLTAAANLPATLPAALFAGDAALATVDLTGVTSFGAASLAGCDSLVSFELSTSATLAGYAFAAGEATVATTLEQDELPAYEATSFLGREASYEPESGALARIEAHLLVAWLAAQDAAGNADVAQPASYNTADLEAWIATQSNAGAMLAFGYEDEYAASADYLALDVRDGTNFVWTAQDAGTDESIVIALEGSYALGEDADWSAANLVQDETTGLWVAADPDEPACFARLRMEKGW